MADDVPMFCLKDLFLIDQEKKKCNQIHIFWLTTWSYKGGLVFSYNSVIFSFEVDVLS